MKITKDMLFELSDEMNEGIIEELQSYYLEYPSGNQESEGVIELHGIGKSRHFDMRFKIGNHLIGYAIVGFSEDMNPSLGSFVINKGFRAELKCESEECNEWKFKIWEEGDNYLYEQVKGVNIHSSYDVGIEELAQQPLIWLFSKRKIGDQFEFKPGTVGAGVEAPGIMKVLDRVKVKFGTLKPYFREYFIKGNSEPFKDWTRIVFTAIITKGLDPETKAPTGEKERLWRFMIPKEQRPYAISRRAIVTKKWKAPKGIIPFPEEWAQEKFPEDYKKWKGFMGEKEELSSNRFSFSMVSWMGARAKSGRRMPQYRYYLLIKDQSNSVMSYLVDGNMTRDTYLSLWEFERVSTKWLSESDDIAPKEVFNPNKDLYAKYTVLESGSLTMDKKVEEGIEKIDLKIRSGLLKGNWQIVQDQKGSETRTIQRLSQEELTSDQFVLHKHTLDGKSHFDIRFKKGWEVNLFGDPLTDNYVRAFKKECPNVDEWWITSGKKEMKVGSEETTIDFIDKGSVTFFSEEDDFISMDLSGEKLKGLWVLIKDEKGWIFKRSSKPGEEKLSGEGDPSTGDPFDPPHVSVVKGRQTFRVTLYDPRMFTRCEEEEKTKKYLDFDLPSGVSVGICLFTRPNTTHGARIGYILFDKDQWSEEKALNWVKEKNLGSFLKGSIRGEGELVQEPVFAQDTTENVWIEVTFVDVPGREIKGFLLLEGGKREIQLKTVTDHPMVKILSAYSRGSQVMQFRLWKGFILEFLSSIGGKDE